MRALTLILIAGLLALWAYFLVEVHSEKATAPVMVPVETTEETNAASLNNTAVLLDRAGRPADALAYLERAHGFRPSDPVIHANYEHQRARVRQAGWWRVLIVASAVALVLFVGGGIWRGTRRVLDRSRLARLRLRGRRRIHIAPEAKEAELDLRFSEPVNGLVRRHPPNVVWTSSERNQHMKSRRSIRVKGRDCTIRLDGERLEQLRRFPGEWRCILRLGKTEVGEAAARVG